MPPASDCDRHGLGRPSSARFLPAIAMVRRSYGVPSMHWGRHAAPSSPDRKRAPMPDNLDPALLSAEDMLAEYARRRLSPEDVLQAITERVARLNPGLNAFAVLNPAAIQAAGESASRWRSGRPLGILDGVPCTVKDLVDLGGFPTR